ncbi:helix-turn-helix domain-containing protein [Nevskia soli]|jgi:DNA-binding CsgD family transcriptional regulator|uniref:helix-turn-helix domain-containing protein n=1 Tax=Nevskia soli TaxID=418856 RepID=UPI0015D9143D|nr:LuxR family transcriptional regulator [Nevskia soli]
MKDVETASTEELVRLLVERSECAANLHGVHEPNAEDVLFDIKVEESRYLLVRLPKPPQQSVQLSPREREIVRLVARGHSNKIIADVLSISSWTVCTHLRRIFAKLGVGSRAAMVACMPELSRTAASAQEPPVINRSERDLHFRAAGPAGK